MGTYKDWLAHYGIQGMHWGERNGPPYPLGTSQLSSKERRLYKKKARQYTKQLNKLDQERAENKYKLSVLENKTVGLHNDSRYKDKNNSTEDEIERLKRRITMGADETQALLDEIGGEGIYDIKERITARNVDMAVGLLSSKYTYGLGVNYKITLDKNASKHVMPENNDDSDYVKEINRVRSMAKTDEEKDSRLADIDKKAKEGYYNKKNVNHGRSQYEIDSKLSRAKNNDSWELTFLEFTQNATKMPEAQMLKEYKEYLTDYDKWMDKVRNGGLRKYEE